MSIKWEFYYREICIDISTYQEFGIVVAKSKSTIDASVILVGTTCGVIQFAIPKEPSKIFSLNQKEKLKTGRGRLD